MGGADGEDHAVGRARRRQVGGRQGLGAEPSPQLTTTEPPLPPGAVVKSATVEPWLASVKVPSRTVPVVIPSMPVISVPLELVSGASRTVTAVRRAGQRGGRAAQGRDDDAERSGGPRGLLGVGVAAEDLEDRVARIVAAVSGVTPICWTTSVTPATVGVPSPQPPTASVGVDVGDRGQGVGVGERRQHEHAGVLALDRGEVVGRAGDRQVGDGGRAGDDDLRAAVVVNGDEGREDARLGVGVAALDVEHAGGGGGDDACRCSSASRRPSRWWP